MRQTGSVGETYFFKRTPRAHLPRITSPSDTPLSFFDIGDQDVCTVEAFPRKEKQAKHIELANASPGSARTSR